MMTINYNLSLAPMTGNASSKSMEMLKLLSPDTK